MSRSNTYGSVAWLAFATAACSGAATGAEASPQQATTVAGASAGHPSVGNAGHAGNAPVITPAHAAGSGAAGMSPKPSRGAGGTAAPARAASSDDSDDAGAPDGKLYSDDFEDGDLTKPSWIDADPELGGKWQVVAADGGKALAQTASVSDWVIAAGGDYRWADQVVEARVKITSEPGKAGIFARLRDTRNYYFLYIDGGSNLVLRKRIDNSSSDIQKVKVKTMADTWYTLELSVVGDKLTGYLDGNMLVSGSDSGVSTGGIGVGTADCTAQFDDISVHGG